jgi:hypothetical protein
MTFQKDNRLRAAATGSIIGISISRFYVYMSGSLDVVILGHVLHHIDYGFAILILVAFALVVIKTTRIRIPTRLIPGIIGFSLGLITDEINIFMNLGRRYNLSSYNSPINMIADLILVSCLLMFADGIRITTSGDTKLPNDKESYHH